MKTITTSVLCVLFLGKAYSQGFTESTQNSQVKYYISNNGAMFNNPAGPSGGYLIPKDSMINAIFAMLPMCAGEDVNGQLKGATAAVQNSDFFRGPIATNYLLSEYMTRFSESIWYMSNGEVQNHIDHWMEPGYIMSANIENWPGNGNTANGESSMLAPFHDVNQDGIYSPEDGDYPLIRGDKALYTIVNERANLHPSGLEPIGLEMHMMVYQFENATDPLLTNTTFVWTTLYNRGTQTLYDFIFGHLVDFDLGNPMDDYIGTDPFRDLSYAYNSDLNDEDFSGNPGYGINPPAVGVIALDRNMSSNVLNTTSFNTSSEIYNALHGLHNDGTPFLNDNGDATTYMYFGAVSGWNESTAGDVPGDRRVVMGYEGFTLKPFSSACFNNAIVYARSEDGSIFSSVDSLFEVTDYIQTFFDTQEWECSTNLNINELKTLSLSLYPNPAQNQISVQGINSGTFRVVSLDGKVIKSGELNSGSIDVETLENGYYILEINSEGKGGREAFVKD